MAPIWNLLTTAEGYNRWADATVVAAVPPGPAEPGQCIELRSWALGRGWPVHFEIGAVEPMHGIEITVRLPFGIVNHEHISLVALSDRETRVSFN